jgi:hypothetical protein
MNGDRRKRTRTHAQDLETDKIGHSLYELRASYPLSIATNPSLSAKLLTTDFALGRQSRQRLKRDEERAFRGRAQ